MLRPGGSCRGNSSAVPATREILRAATAFPSVAPNTITLFAAAPSLGSAAEPTLHPRGAYVGASRLLSAHPTDHRWNVTSVRSVTKTSDLMTTICMNARTWSARSPVADGSGSWMVTATFSPRSRSATASGRILMGKPRCYHRVRVLEDHPAPSSPMRGRRKRSHRPIPVAQHVGTGLSGFYRDGRTPAVPMHPPVSDALMLNARNDGSATG